MKAPFSMGAWYSTGAEDLDTDEEISTAKYWIDIQTGINDEGEPITKEITFKPTDGEEYRLAGQLYQMLGGFRAEGKTIPASQMPSWLERFVPKTGENLFEARVRRIVEGEIDRCLNLGASREMSRLSRPNRYPLGLDTDELSMEAANNGQDASAIASLYPRREEPFEVDEAAAGKRKYGHGRAGWRWTKPKRRR